MEKQELKSKWDDLVREIGVEIPPETQQREEAAANASQNTVPDTHPPEPRTPVQPPPKRAAVDWDNLAGELGLPPSERPAPPAVEESQEPASRKLPETRPPDQPANEQGGGREQRDRQRHERGGRRERHERHERHERSDSRQRDEGTAKDERGGRTEHGEGEPAERDERAGERSEHGERESRGRGERGDRGGRRERGERESGGRERPRGGRGRGRGRGPRDAESAPRDERREPRHRDDEINRPKGADTESAAETPPERSETERVEQPNEEQPKSNAAVSLWHKIFGTPTEQAAKIVDEVHNEPDAVVTGTIRDEPRGEGTGFAEPHITADVEASPYRDEFDRGEGAAAVDDEDSEAGQRRGRPRRRRGRGRGRKTEDRQQAPRSTERRDDRPPRPDKPTEFDDDDETDDLLDDSGLEDDGDDEQPTAEGSSKSKTSLQRTIPSWDEAIGFIVDSNMQTRSQRRPPPRSGSRDNGPRGRSRGRRKS